MIFGSFSHGPGVGLAGVFFGQRYFGRRYALIVTKNSEFASVSNPRTAFGARNSQAFRNYGHHADSLPQASPNYYLSKIQTAPQPRFTKKGVQPCVLILCPEAFFPTTNCPITRANCASSASYRARI